MADIDVVPKRRTNLWIWVVLALVVIVVLWMVFGRGASASRSSQLNDVEPMAPVVRVTAST